MTTTVPSRFSRPEGLLDGPGAPHRLDRVIRPPRPQVTWTRAIGSSRVALTTWVAPNSREHSSFWSNVSTAMMLPAPTKAAPWMSVEADAARAEDGHARARGDTCPIDDGPGGHPAGDKAHDIKRDVLPDRGQAGLGEDGELRRSEVVIDLGPVLQRGSPTDVQPVFDTIAERRSRALRCESGPGHALRRRAGRGSRPRRDHPVPRAPTCSRWYSRIRSSAADCTSNKLVVCRARRCSAPGGSTSR